MKKASRRREPKTGDVFEIPLEEGGLAYGHILPWNLVGFYALRSDQRVPLATVVESGVAFRVMCMTDRVSDGRWPVIGNVPPPHVMTDPIKFWRPQAPPGEARIIEWRADVCYSERRVNRSDVVGIEVSATVNSIGILSRLKCFFRDEPWPFLEIG